LVDPGNSYRNVLAGQLVALSLSLGFDSYDAGFGISNASLANAVFISGTFQGWTVGEVVAEANRSIGGCGSSYSAAQLNQALSTVNENYVGGDTDQGALSCPPAPKPGAQGPRLRLKVLNTTAQGHLELEVGAVPQVPVTLELRDATGRQLGPRRSITTFTDDPLRLGMELTGLAPGGYLVIAQQGAEHTSRRFVLEH
jgi:hypothetical protein